MYLLKYLQLFFLQLISDRVAFRIFISVLQSGGPHPFMDETLRLMRSWTPALRRKIHFTHLNHSNPVCDPDSAERRALETSGAQLATLGDRFEF